MFTFLDHAVLDGMVIHNPTILFETTSLEEELTRATFPKTQAK